MGLSLHQNQSQKQLQSLSLTPQMVQALKILQVSNEELCALIEEAVAKNPLLESDYRSKLSSHEPFDTLTLLATEEDLSETLMGLLLPKLKTKEDKLIAEMLIYNLDEKGYLDFSLKEIAQKIGSELENVAAVLHLLQQSAPIKGIGARDLQECLALQTQDPAVLALLPHLTLIAKRDFKSLKSFTGLSEISLNYALEDLKALNPKPALGFAKSDKTLKDPDIIIEVRGTSFQAKLNELILPKITLNQKMRLILKNSCDRKNSALSKMLEKEAHSLFKMIGNRHETLLKTAEAIIELQEDYFKNGKAFLKPMTLKIIAEKTGFHESTISRAVSHKTLLSPQGMVDMKFFFTSAINDNETSSEAVKMTIKTLIEKETKPLSDDALVVILSQQGVKLARRTVMKYRESLHIPSSYLRHKAL